MQIVRTIVWMAVTALLVAFIAINWHSAEVNIWPRETGYLYFQWPVGFIALVFFVLGFLPTWLLHRASRWSHARRIAALENALAAQSIPAPPPVPAPSMSDPLPPA